MTITTKAYQIAAFQSQLRVFIVVLDVMNDLCFSLPSIPLAALALVAVAPEYLRSFSLPVLRLEEFFFIHSICFGIPPHGSERYSALGGIDVSLYWCMV